MEERARHGRAHESEIGELTGDEIELPAIVRMIAEDEKME